MPKHLIIFTLGPIQDFIASARRSRDLWYGSWLLSDLSRTAARMVVDKHGLDALIFPSPNNERELKEDSKLGIANKIVAIVPGSAQDAAALAQAIEEAVSERLMQLAAEVFDRIGNSNLDDRATAEAQVADLLEFYWVAQPLAQDNADYAYVRRYLEALMAARKGTRDFRQLPGRSGYPKSSLDGMRETVIPENRYPKNSDPLTTWLNQAQALYATYGAGPAEQLSGVDLLKRQGSLGKHFPSTSHFAALPFLKRLNKNTVQQKLPAFLARLAAQGVQPDKTSFPIAGAPLGEYDGSLLFASRLTEGIKGEEQKRRIGNDLDDFLQAIAGNARPQPYYALLHADGDHMGKTIDALAEPAQHQQISAALNRFAGRVEGIVASHDGVAVYSGGDDVLAFLPLHSALACAGELADAFAAELGAFQDGNGHSPTLSTGLAITHHLEPLSDALEGAKKAEKAAKRVKGKHGLAITLSKRGGVDRTVAGPRLDLLPRLRRLIELHRQPGAIPAGAAYQIQEMLAHLEGAAGAEALNFETRRILQRKSSTSEETQQWLRQLLATPTINPAELMNEMILAQFLASAQALAEGE